MEAYGESGHNIHGHQALGLCCDWFAMERCLGSTSGDEPMKLITQYVIHMASSFEHSKCLILLNNPLSTIFTTASVIILCDLIDYLLFLPD